MVSFTNMEVVHYRGKVTLYAVRRASSPFYSCLWGSLFSRPASSNVCASAPACARAPSSRARKKRRPVRQGHLWWRPGGGRRWRRRCWGRHRQFDSSHEIPSSAQQRGTRSRQPRTRSTGSDSLSPWTLPAMLLWLSESKTKVHGRSSPITHAEGPNASQSCKYNDVVDEWWNTHWSSA